MLEYVSGSTMRLPVVLQTSAGTAFTGALVAAVNFSIIKSNGVMADVTLTSSDWVEVTATAYSTQGYYNALLPASYSNVLGVFQYCARVAGANPYFGVVKVVEGDATSIMQRLGVPNYGTIKDDISNVGVTAGSGGFTSQDRTWLSSTFVSMSQIPVTDVATNTRVLSYVTQSFWTTDRNNMAAIKQATDNLPIDPASNAVVATYATGTYNNVNSNTNSGFTSIKGTGWAGTYDTLHSCSLMVQKTYNSGALETTLTGGLSGVRDYLAGASYNSATDNLHSITVAIQGITPGSGGGGFSVDDRAMLSSAYSATLGLPADPTSWATVSGALVDNRARIMGSGTYGYGAGRTIYQVDVTASQIKAKTDYIPNANVASAQNVADARDYLAGPGFTTSASLAGISASLSQSNFTAQDRANIQNMSGVTNLIRNDTVAINAKTTNLPNFPADQTIIDTQYAVLSGAAAVSGGFSVDDRNNITAIKAKTDNLPLQPADAAVTFGASDRVTLNAINGKTTNLPADPSSNTALLNITGLASTNNPNTNSLLLHITNTGTLTLNRLGTPAGASIAADVANASSSAVNASSSALQAKNSADTASSYASNASTYAYNSWQGVTLVSTKIGTPISGTLVDDIWATTGSAGSASVDLSTIIGLQNRTLSVLGTPITSVSRDIVEVGKLIVRVSSSIKK